MAPTAPQGEQDIVDQFDKWIESIRTLEAMKEECRLPDPFKVTALEQIMSVGQATLYFENTKIAGGSFAPRLQEAHLTPCLPNAGSI